MFTALVRLCLLLFSCLTTLAQEPSPWASVIAAASLPSSTPPSVGLKTSLIGYWAMEQATGANAPDSTAQGNTLTLTGTSEQDAQHIGGTYSAKISSSASYFTGNGSDLVFNGATSFSGSVWVWRSSAPGGPIVAEWGATYKFYVDTTAGVATLYMRNGADSGSVTAVSAVTMTANAWHLICYGYDSVAQQIWLQVDNETRVNTSYTDTPRDGLGFTLGNFTDGSGSAGNNLDEVAFWKGRSLGTNDVSEIWNGGTGKFYAAW